MSIICLLCLLQRPGRSVLGVVDDKACIVECVSDLVAGSPVFGLLGLLAQAQHHLHDLAISLFSAGVALSGIVFQAQQVEGEEAHGVAEFLEIVGRDLCLVVDKAG